mgnify:CR=1 FL=1
MMQWDSVLVLCLGSFGLGCVVTMLIARAETRKAIMYYEESKRMAEQAAAVAEKSRREIAEFMSKYEGD